MEGFWVATCLLLIYVAAQFAVRHRPLEKIAPLDVDANLTYPSVSQAGSVLSLSALFGAYLGMYWLLGFPVIVGIALGSMAALVFIRSMILRSGASTFESFLCQTFVGRDRQTGLALSVLLVATQIAYIASELLILRQLLLTGFHLAPRHATIVVTAVAVIGYLYVLRGGYVALFRADTVQAIFVVLMVGALLASAPHVASSAVQELFRIRHVGYWEFGGAPPKVLAFLHIVIGAVMGFSFLAPSSDTWKRVFLVGRRPSRRPFLILALASIAPFLVTLPLILVAIPPRTGNVVLLDAFPGLRQHELLLVLTLLGMIASSLSAFNGSIVSAVHITIVTMRGGNAGATNTLDDYYWAMATALLAFCALFFGLLRFGNAYLLGNWLIAPFAAGAGLLVGTGGLRRGPPAGSLLTLLALCFAAWTVWLLRDPSVLTATATAEVETIPVGLLPFPLAIAFGALGGRRRKDEHA